MTKMVSNSNWTNRIKLRMENNFMFWVNIKDTDVLLHTRWSPAFPSAYTPRTSLPSFFIFRRTQTHFGTFTGQKHICSRTNTKLQCYFWSLSVAFPCAPSRVCNTHRKHPPVTRDQNHWWGTAWVTACWFVPANLWLLSSSQTKPTLTFLPSRKIKLVQIWMPHKCGTEHMNGYSHLHNYWWCFKENVTICRMLGRKTHQVHLW